ncbi:hypothetical protein ACOSQ2_030887 [Xanthoceras sorbifolium]
MEKEDEQEVKLEMRPFNVVPRADPEVKNEQALDKSKSSDYQSTLYKFSYDNVGDMEEFVKHWLKMDIGVENCREVILWPQKYYNKRYCKAIGLPGNNRVEEGLKKMDEEDEKEFKPVMRPLNRDPRADSEGGSEQASDKSKSIVEDKEMKKAEKGSKKMEEEDEKEVKPESDLLMWFLELILKVNVSRHGQIQAKW